MNSKTKIPDYRRRTKLLLQTAVNGRVGVRDLERIFPDTARQIRDDAKAVCFGLWGQSFNFDEHEKKSIVDPKLLTTVGKLAKHQIRAGRLYHAGLIHTYGYLMSNLKTRFGYKRERWTNGLIENAFQLPAGTLLGIRDGSTLLQNVTFLMAGVSFTGKERSGVAFGLPGVAEPVRDIAFHRLSVTRIEERVDPRHGNGKLKLLTDLVSFGRRSALDCMLVYSYELHAQQFLVTCFGMSAENRKLLLAEAKAGETPVRTRYNLALPSLDLSFESGKRSIRVRKPNAI